ncbi:hypothetical protein IL306_000023 [Fusarium sp. DS 682]|nr:hypothetical protein IL306_000023 [Fusarium sp. DS 682]
MNQNLPTISLVRRSAEPIRHEDNGQLSPLMNHAIELDKKYRESGALADLETAISTSWEALAAASDDEPGQTASDEANRIANELEKVHPQHLLVLKTLRARLVDRYALTGSEDDLERAISTARQSIKITSDNKWDELTQFADLSSLLGRKYLDTGAMEDFEEAISMGWKAMELEKVNNHSNRPHLLQLLGVCWDRKR